MALTESYKDPVQGGALAYSMKLEALLDRARTDASQASGSGAWVPRSPARSREGPEREISPERDPHWVQVAHGGKVSSITSVRLNHVWSRSKQPQKLQGTDSCLCYPSKSWPLMLWAGCISATTPLAW